MDWPTDWQSHTFAMQLEGTIEWGEGVCNGGRVQGERLGREKGCVHVPKEGMPGAGHEDKCYV